MRLLAIIAFVALALAQEPPLPPPTPGVITKSASVGIVSGSLRCTLTTADAGVHTSVYCYVGTNLACNMAGYVFAVTSRLAGGGLGCYYGRDMVTVNVYRPEAGGPIAWDVVANGTPGSDFFK